MHMSWPPTGQHKHGCHGDGCGRRVGTETHKGCLAVRSTWVALTNIPFTVMTKFRIKGQGNRFHTCNENSTVTWQRSMDTGKGGISGLLKQSYHNPVMS